MNLSLGNIALQHTQRASANIWQSLSQPLMWCHPRAHPLSLRGHRAAGAGCVGLTEHINNLTPLQSCFIKAAN